MSKSKSGRQKAAPVRAKQKKTKKATKAKKAAKAVGTCFIMMPFGSPFDLYCESLLKPAVRAAGLTPLLTEDLFGPRAIVDDIWRMIQKAKVLLAVLTGKNPNVFYELGLAHAIGKPVVLVSQTLDDVPFDVGHIRVVTYDWEAPDWGETLRAGITASLKETLDDPVSAVPSTFVKKVPSQAPEKDELLLRLEALERWRSSLAGALPSKTGRASTNAVICLEYPRAGVSEATADKVLRRIRHMQHIQLGPSEIFGQILREFGPEVVEGITIGKSRGDDFLKFRERDMLLPL